MERVKFLTIVSDSSFCLYKTQIMWTTWTPSITQIQDSGIKTMPRSNSTSYPSLFASHKPTLFALLPHTFCIIVTGENPFEYIGKAIVSHNTSVCRVKQVGAKQKRGTKNMRNLKPNSTAVCNRATSVIFCRTAITWLITAD